MRGNKFFDLLTDFDYSALSIQCIGIRPVLSDGKIFCRKARTSVTLGVASSVVNDAIVRIAGSRVASAVGASRATDVIMRMTSQ